MDNNNNTFEYTYSAPQQEEIKKIRQKYLPQNQTISKIEQLRQLDKSAEKPGRFLSIIIGILGTLMLGIGMSCTMVYIDLFVEGIVIGVIGIGIILTAYPIYKAVTKRKRKKIAPQILKLTEELENGIN